MFKSFKPFDSGMPRGTVKCEVLLSIFRQERGNCCASSPPGRAVRRHGACRSNLAYEKLEPADVGNRHATLGQCDDAGTDDDIALVHDYLLK